MNFEGKEIILEENVNKQTIEDRIVKFGSIEHCPEYDWGDAVGREMW